MAKSVLPVPSIPGESIQGITAGVVPSGSNQGVTARHIRFAPSLAPGKVRREFHQPRNCMAVEEPLHLHDVPAAKVWPEPAEQLVVLCFSQKPSAEWRRFIDQWLTAPEPAEAPRPIVITANGTMIQWRPGRAVIVAKEDSQEDLLAALTDFAFYEGELRGLETALRGGEADAHADVQRAYRIRLRDVGHWSRFTQLIQRCYDMRLTFAQLEPRLLKGARNLPDAAHGWFARLLRKAHLESRLEEFSDRLEACEDLYEGASDRVSDFLGYFYGHVLEVIIVALLLAEVALVAVELVGPKGSNDADASIQKFVSRSNCQIVIHSLLSLNNL